MPVADNAEALSAAPWYHAIPSGLAVGPSVGVVIGEGSPHA